MNESELVDLLSVHAEGLKDGVDLTEQLIAGKTAEDRRAIAALLHLARRVQAVLVPMEPRSDFVSALQGRLRAEARQARLEAERNRERRRKWMGLAAGIGGLLYLAGLMLLSWRVSLALLGLIAGLLGGRMARHNVLLSQPGEGRRRG